MKKECVILHYLQSVSKLLLSYIDYRQLVYETAQKLDNAHMIRFDMETGNLFPTELGRIASYFYIAYTTVEIINEKLFDSSTLLTILTIIAMSQVIYSFFYYTRNLLLLKYVMKKLKNYKI